MRASLVTIVLAGALLVEPTCLFGQAGGSADSRVSLGTGWLDAASAASGLELLAHRDRPEGFFDASDPGNISYANTDLALRSDYAFVGNYNGFNTYDISDPTNPELLASIVCPGGQGDLSIHGDLLFMSVEETRSRIDCGPAMEEAVEQPVDPGRFRGVRIFDVSDVLSPRQVAAVQTCRGSHTHTLVRDPDDGENVYVYVSGTGAARAGAELEGCADRDPGDPGTSYWRISVIQVPLDAPEEARIVGEPRVFADPITGDIAGLWRGGDHGPGTQDSSETTSCHDITAYPEIGLAAGACQGNGVLLDITDPADPVRIEEVTDENFALWHSATFNNDGTKVIFTDEWGGGRAARCLDTDDPNWGANAVFELVDGELRFGSYYKLPAPQTATENCVAHNGSLIPVPGRDIKVQAWYQGGISVFDFTDAENPYEIAYFDRGPVSGTELLLAGYWSAYWYNGYIYGSEISRGFDVFELAPSEHLTENEIAAARLVQVEQFNAQGQPRIRWPASLVVARAYLDQVARAGDLSTERIAALASELAAIEDTPDGVEKRAALSEAAVGLWSDVRAAEAEGAPEAVRRIRNLLGAVLDLAATLG